MEGKGRVEEGKGDKGRKEGGKGREGERRGGNGQCAGKPREEEQKATSVKMVTTGFIGKADEAFCVKVNSE